MPNPSTALVTGAAQGLGLELTRALLAADVPLVVATDMHTGPSAALLDLQNSSGGRLHYLPLNITDAPSLSAAVSALAPLLGERGLDLLLNNAGIQTIEPTGPLAMPTLSSTFAVNVQGTYNATSALLPLLRRGHAKTIVNVSSTLGSIGSQAAGLWTDVPLASYKISKAALNQMTVLLANALRAAGFAVFAVSPGWMRTPIAGGGPSADLDPALSARLVVQMALEARVEDCGRYRNVLVEGFERYDGKDVTW